MAELIGFLQFSLACSFGLALVIVICLALPDSKLKDVLSPFAKVAFALICGLYAISPIDALPELALGPFGLIDDAGAVLAGFMALCSAFTKPKEGRAA